MFYKYEIRNINNQDVLYLYLSLKYEFSNEFIDDYNLKVLSKNFIKMNNISFHGQNIYYVIDGIVVKKLNISQNNNNSDYYSPDKFLINMKLKDNSMCEITLRDYLLSVLFNYYSDKIHIEVLKAICILYNTYAYKSMKDEKYILSDNSFMKYEYYTFYQEKFQNYLNLIKIFNNIIDEVACMYLSYNNDYILPFIHFSNNGRTLINKNYSYLSSVKSLWDLCSPSYINVKDFNKDELNKNLNIRIDYPLNIKIINNGDNISINGNSFSIMELKTRLNLFSNDISIIVNNNYIRFITRGLGNGLGLSIFGATSIAENGGKYFNILNYYFPKVKIFKYVKELS